MINKVILLGNVGQNPETKKFDNGSQVSTFSVATSERYKDKNGEMVDSTEWHRVNAWGKLSEVVEKYLTKGKQVFIEGKIQTRKYTDNNGVEKYATEINARTIKMLGRKENGGNMPTESDAPSDPMRENRNNDDIPF